MIKLCKRTSIIIIYYWNKLLFYLNKITIIIIFDLSQITLRFYFRKLITISLIIIFYFRKIIIFYFRKIIIFYFSDTIFCIFGKIIIFYFRKLTTMIKIIIFFFRKGLAGSKITCQIF